MKANEIVEQLKTASPNALGKISEKAATRIVKLALAEVGRQLALAEEGTIKVMGLGGFKIKMVEKEKEGVKVKSKRISFTAAKPVDKAKRQAKKKGDTDPKPAE